MLYWLYELTGGEGPMNLFRYISFRAGGAFFTALIFAFLFGRPLIEYLRRVQKKGQPIRHDGPEGHFVKAGTPTMGGAMIIGGTVLSASTHDINIYNDCRRELIGYLESLRTNNIKAAPAM